MRGWGWRARGRAARCAETTGTRAAEGSAAEFCASLTSPGADPSRVLAAGVVSPWRFAAALARRPGLLPELLRLARHTNHAARQLAVTLTDLVAS